MSVQNQAMAMQKNSSVCNRKMVDVFKEHKADFELVLVGSYSDLATKLFSKDLLPDEIYDKITDKSAMASTDHERVRSLLLEVYRMLKNKEKKDVVKIWSDFIRVLKTEEAWKPLVRVLESELQKAETGKVEKPEARVFKQNMDSIANITQGGLLQLAMYLEQYGILTSAETFINPNSKHENLYTIRMLQIVENAIEKTEDEFDVFIKIMKDLGGPAYTMAKAIEDGRPPDHR